jgi:hypothetical protein
LAERHIGQGRGDIGIEARRDPATGVAREIHAIGNQGPRFNLTIQPRRREKRVANGFDKGYFVGPVDIGIGRRQVGPLAMTRGET